MEINTYGRITHEVYNAKHIYTNTHSRSYREEDTNRFKKNYIANEYSNNIPECKLDILPLFDSPATIFKHFAKNAKKTPARENGCSAPIAFKKLSIINCSYF